jgi:hypothetical protein
LALASNAPTSLKTQVSSEIFIESILTNRTQALRLLPSNLNFPLSEISITPYLPVPETHGEEWDRLEPASVLDVLVELAVHGEYNGLEARKWIKDGLELRAAAVTVFEVCLHNPQEYSFLTFVFLKNFVNRIDIRLAIIQDMLPPENSGRKYFDLSSRVRP